MYLATIVTVLKKAHSNTHKSTLKVKGCQDQSLSLCSSTLKQKRATSAQLICTQGFYVKFIKGLMRHQVFLLLFTHFIQPGKKPVSHLLTPTLLLFFCLQDKLGVHPQHFRVFIITFICSSSRTAMFSLSSFFGRKSLSHFPLLCFTFSACVYVAPSSIRRHTQIIFEFLHHVFSPKLKWAITFKPDVVEQKGH